MSEQLVFKQSVIDIALITATVLCNSIKLHFQVYLSTSKNDLSLPLKLKT